VIVRGLGALPEVVQDSGGGFIYRTDDDLTAAINRLAATPALRTELGEKGYQAFVRWWTKEAHIQLYFDFLGRTALKKFGHIPWEADKPAKSVVMPQVVSEQTKAA